MFPLLQDVYETAIKELDPSTTTKAAIDSDEHHLAMHLMWCFWRGVPGAAVVARTFLDRGGVGAFDFIGRAG